MKNPIFKQGARSAFAHAALALAGLLLSASAFAATSDVPLEESGVDLDDRASLQPGAAPDWKSSKLITVQPPPSVVMSHSTLNDAPGPVPSGSMV